MAEVILKGVSKVYEGKVKAVDGADIHINDQEFVVFVGPSGCGKTTTLRMVAGLEDISGGEIFIDGKKVNDLPPKDRDIAMVFQNYALYPHMSVYDNMAFGLKIRKTPKEEIEERVGAAAEILDIKELLDRKPRQLSGGQRQRVAVGRAIVRQPKVFLFDEPLSNLDAKLRVQMRTEISALHNRLKATMIYVTHDQVEAMTMGDKIVVLNGGKIQQIGSPLELYNRPVNRFVASFIGSPPMNLVLLKVEEKNGRVFVSSGNVSIALEEEKRSVLQPYVGKSLYVGVRPEDVKIAWDSPDPDNDITAQIEVVETLGAETHLYLSANNQQFIIRTSPDHDYKVGDKIHLSVNLSKVHYFDTDTEKSLFHSK